MRSNLNYHSIIFSFQRTGIILVDGGPGSLRLSQCGGLAAQREGPWRGRADAVHRRLPFLSLDMVAKREGPSVAVSPRCVRPRRRRRRRAQHGSNGPRRWASPSMARAGGPTGGCRRGCPWSGLPAFTCAAASVACPRAGTLIL